MLLVFPKGSPLRRLAKSWFGRFATRHARYAIPRGLDFFWDVANSLQDYRFSTIFDVGANVGQSATMFRKACPGADIYCFEPVAETHAKLQEHFKHQPGVRCFRLAMSAETGQGVVCAPGKVSTKPA